ncbi:MAG: sensor histidine kinase [Phycisphaerales bacterium JB065]
MTIKATTMNTSGTAPAVSTVQPLRIAPPVVGSAEEEGAGSELDRLQHRVADLEAQLERAERLVTLGSMTGSVAHELNNMLTPLLSYAGLALSNLDDEAIVRKALQKTLQTAERAGEVTDSLLRSTCGANRTVSGSCLLNAVVDDAFASLVRNPSRDGVEVLIDVPSELQLAISHGAMQQVLMNLILNACDAMRPGPGTLAITARTAHVDIDQPCSHGNTNKNHSNEAVIRVADTGPGMPPDLIDSVFEPLVTTKTEPRSEQRGGAGLGLTVCRKLITQAGGDITVRSGQGLGTCFSIRIPLATAIHSINSAA